MEYDAAREDKRDSISKAVSNIRESLDSHLSRIKVGLEKSYLNLLRKSIAAFDHSYWKYRKKE